MTRAFLPLRRIAALSVAITLFSAPIASAQSPEAEPVNAALPNTALLSKEAFARLVRPQADGRPARVGADSPRPGLLRQIKMAVARQDQAAPPKGPDQRSWARKHRTALIVWSAIAGGVALLAAYAVNADD